ncbi:MAG: DUF2845 domain-containing protein [Chromatiales bacterium]|jgi:hypothetical protein
MRTKGLLGAAVALTAVGVQQAPAATMRCGTELIDVGASVYDLEKECGQPSSRQGDEWIYDRGPEELRMIVRVGEGEVQSIRIEGEGRP